MLVSVLVTASAHAESFDLVAVHPEVAAQPTNTGNRIDTLKPFNGRLYAGYGDYSANTGPIAVRAYDPALGAFTDSMLSSATEAIYIYRELNGRLYAPNIDTKGGGSGYAVGIPNTAPALDTWQDRITVDGIHMYDMNTHSGTDLFQGGVASNGDGIVYRSIDNGATWTESLRMPAGTGDPDNIDVRIYGLGLYQGKLYADADQLYAVGSGFGARQGRKSPPSMVFDGTSWTEGPRLTPSGFANHMVEFGGKLVFQDFHPGIGGSHLQAFDGSRVGAAYKPKGRNAGTSAIYDFTIDDGTLYALLIDGQVVTTTDLRTWSFLDREASAALRAANNLVTSIGVLDDTLYLGGVGGNLYAYSGALSPLTLSSESAAFDLVPEPAGAGVVLLLGVLATTRRAARPMSSAHG